MKSGARVEEAQRRWALTINAANPAEVAFGSSTTMLLQSLSRSMARVFKPGDEVIVTNVDHEANIGPWLNLQQDGIKVKSWNINPHSFTLDLDDLGKLMTDKTRLVAFTHTSNILGTINPVKTITHFVHERGAQVCVDGVAFAPHRLIDVQDWEVDYYVFSLYKVYGPHYALLYGKKEHFDTLPGINHFFIDEVPYKLQPGNVNYELSYGVLGITDYFGELVASLQSGNTQDYHQQLALVFDSIASHEETLSAMLLDYLNKQKNVRIIGDTHPGKNKRVPTISFMVENRKSSAITREVDKAGIGIRYGDFYARRLINSLGLADQDGVVRVSLVHYNTKAEVEKLIAAFEQIL